MKTKVQQYQDAVFAAKAFIDKAQTALAAQEKGHRGGTERGIYAAAAKRSSMDLTRLLAELRKPQDCD